MVLSFEHLSALVVEDLPPMRKLMASVLETLGLGQIHSASSGAEGFEHFCKYNPDIVISDWHMAPDDGLSLTRQIRKNIRSPNRFAPVILVSGYSARERVALARDSGIHEFIVKPFSAEDIAKRLAHVINHPRDFVDSPAYCGPTRRRRIDTAYHGPLRRAEDLPKQTHKFYKQG